MKLKNTAVSKQHNNRTSEEKASQTRGSRFKSVSGKAEKDVAGGIGIKQEE